MLEMVFALHSDAQQTRMPGTSTTMHCSIQFTIHALSMLTRDACKANEDKSSGHETVMSSCWSLLCDILGEAKGRGVPAAPVNKFAEALVQGGWQGAHC